MHNLREIENVLYKLKNVLKPTFTMEAIDINEIKGVFLANNTFNIAMIQNCYDYIQLIDAFNDDILATHNSVPFWSFPFGFNVEQDGKNIEAFMIDLKYYLPNVSDLTKLQLELIKEEINRFLAKNNTFYDEVFILRRKR